MNRAFGTVHRPLYIETRDTWRNVGVHQTAFLRLTQLHAFAVRTQSLHPTNFRESSSLQEQLCTRHKALVGGMSIKSETLSSTSVYPKLNFPQTEWPLVALAVPFCYFLLMNSISRPVIRYNEASSISITVFELFQWNLNVYVAA